MPTETCELCDIEITDYFKSHNAAPLAVGRCCDDCNRSRVIPARMSAYLKSRTALSSDGNQPPESERNGAGKP